ncbi:MAG: 50S ribosomal protein L24 [Bacteroidota bacterium]
MQKKLHIKKGDQVIVIAGSDKDLSKSRKVLSVDRDKMRAFVEGANMVSVHTKPNAQYPQGGIIKKEASIHVSNLMLVDPESGKPTRIGRKQDKNGKNVRYAKKSGGVIK